MSAGVVLAVVVLAASLAACASSGGAREAPSQDARGGDAVHEVPGRFTIAPDDYHVPFAGTAEDGRRFFLSQELFSIGDPGSSYVGLFLWKADGTFDEVRVDEVARPDGLPLAQAAPAGADALVADRLAELGDYVLEPIEVEPFTEEVDGVTFGWRLGRHDDGSYALHVEPGDFIVYYAPWDGLDYDP